MMKTFRFKTLLSVMSAVLLVSAAAPVFAQESVFIEYAQESLMLEDPKGDDILFQLFVDTCKTGLKKCLLHKNVAPKQTQLRFPRFQEENPILADAETRFVDNSRVVPLFQVERTLANLKKIIHRGEQTGLDISFGRVHSWSKSSGLGLSKIMMALATASSSRFMYVGQETALIEWIKSRPDGSITLEDLFQASLILNQGNVYLTVLTIENVLADATFEKDRENTAVNQKLADLYAGSPNKFGDWYHLFGTMLAGYVGEPAPHIAELYGIYRKISRGENAEKATIAADKAGADLGVKLRQFMYNNKRIQKRLAKIFERQRSVESSYDEVKYIVPDRCRYAKSRF